MRTTILSVFKYSSPETSNLPPGVIKMDANGNYEAYSESKYRFAVK